MLGPAMENNNNIRFSLSRNQLTLSPLQNPDVKIDTKTPEVVSVPPIRGQAKDVGLPTIERPLSTSNETVVISEVPEKLDSWETDRDFKPMDIVEKALSSRGLKCDTKPSMDMAEGYFTAATEMYDQETVNAIRSSDVAQLRKLFEQGRVLQCANKNGETLIHLACRRSNRELVSFLVDEAGVSLHVRDDFGRTPWHDACWRTQPELGLLDLLLERVPELLLLRDKRGHTPLDYARREHWGVLVPFLREKADTFRPVR